MSFLNKINFVNKTQIFMMIIEIRLNFIIMDFNGDLWLKHINMMSKIKKMNYR